MFASEMVAQENHVKSEEYRMVDPVLSRKTFELLVRRIVEDTVFPILLPIIQRSVESSEKDANLEEVLMVVKSQMQSSRFLEPFIASFEKRFLPEEAEEILKFYQSKAGEKFFQSNDLYAPLFPSCFASIEEVLKPYPSLKKETPADPSPLIAVTEENFQKEVLASKIPVIVDVYGAHCPPCKILAPRLADLQSAMGEPVKFVKIDIEKASFLAKEFNIHSVPTLLFFKEGKLVDRHVGLLEKEELCMKCLKAFL